MPPTTTKHQRGNDEQQLQVPEIRCLNKEQAAAYLGIGVTLLETLNVPCLKFGRRTVYDKFDLDAWLVEYKSRERAGKEVKWLVNPDSTGGKTRRIGGSMLSYPTANAYAEVLGLKTEKKP